MMWADAFHMLLGRAPNTGRRRGRSRQQQSGSVLVWVIVVTIMLMGAMFFSFDLIKSTNRMLELDLGYHSQVMNVARAGLADALSWFRRQTTQPVTTFAPRRDLEADPAVNETDDAAVGLVREFEICQSTRVWGRYEVRSDLVQDVSFERGQASAGSVWYIVSVGIVYQRNDEGVSYDASPNKILYRVRMSTEIRRMNIVAPAAAAICTRTPNQTNIGNKVRVMGGTHIGIVYPSGAGTPTINGTVQGTPATSATNPYYDSVDYVFGVTQAELLSMADVYATSEDKLPDPIPDYSLIYIDGNATFNSTRPLITTSIIFCTGNITIAANSNSFFNGLIYCQGNYHQNAPSVVNGCIVGNSNMQFVGSGDYAEVNHDPDILSDLVRRMGQYRFSKGISIE